MPSVNNTFVPISYQGMDIESFKYHVRVDVSVNIKKFLGVVSIWVFGFGISSASWLVNGLSLQFLGDY